MIRRDVNGSVLVIFRRDWFVEYATRCLESAPFFDFSMIFVKPFGINITQAR